MINNIIIKYNTNVERIQTIIKSISDMQVNMSDFENTLKSITDEIDSEIKQLGAIGYNQKDSVNNIYQNGIYMTDKLLEDLDKYNEYYQAIDKCYYIHDTQDFVEVDEKELDIVVDSIISLLTIINNFDGIAESNDSILENLYEFIYNLIKIELNTNGKSKLLNYCENNETEKYFINKNMFKEIKRINESNEDASRINLLLAKNSKLNSTSSEINEELIYAVSVYNGKNKNFDKLSESLGELIYKLSELVGDLSNQNEYKNVQLREIIAEEKKCKQIKSKNFKSLIGNVGPFVLVISMLFGGHYAATRALIGNVYKTEVQTLFSGDEVPKEYVDYLPKIEKINGESTNDVVIIDEKQPWVKQEAEDGSREYFKRIVERTIIDGVEYDDLKAYTNLDMDKLYGNYERSEYVETLDTLDETNNYTNNEIEVTRQTQNLKDSKINSNPDIAILFMVNLVIFFVDIMSIFLIEIITSKNTMRNGLVSNLDYVGENLRGIFYNKFDKKPWIDNIEGIDSRIETLIKNSEKLKNRFNELMNDPKYKIMLDQYSSEISVIKQSFDTIDEASKLMINGETTKLLLKKM